MATSAGVLNLLVGRLHGQKEGPLHAGLRRNIQTAGTSRAIDNRASAANVAASPNPRAASIAPCTEAMNALASSAGVPCSLSCPCAAPFSSVIVSQPLRSSKCPRTSSAISSGIIGASAASIAQMQNDEVPPAMQLDQ